MNKIIASSLVAFATLASVSAFAGGNAQAGKELVDNTYKCGSCHGADLNSPVSPDYPKLAGQNADYIVHALTAYRRGSAGANANGRVNGTMGPVAASIKSDKEIQDIAAYVASLPGNLVTVTESKFRK